MSVHRRTPARPDLERLDDRTLLTAGVTMSLARGVLTVEGTGAADVIRVTVLKPPGRGRPVVDVAGVGRVPLARVNLVVVEGQAGNDFIGVDTNARPGLAVVVRGGEGDDTIRVAGGNIRVDAGPGSNTVNGAADHPAPPLVTASKAPPVLTLVPAPVAAQPAAPSPSPSPTPVATTPSYPTPPTATALANLSVVEAAIVAATNAARVANGLAPLAVDPSLSRAAQLHADDMARLGVMAHELPGVAQPGLVDRAAFVGYSYSWLGENIAFNYLNSNTVMDAWLASPGHRANLLNANFTQIGVGVALDAQGEPYYCQTFGRPSGA